jgi:hypothetical protein
MQAVSASVRLPLSELVRVPLRLIRATYPAIDGLVKAGLLIPSVVLLAGCAPPHNRSSRSSDTVYLQPADRRWHDDRLHPSPRAKAPASSDHGAANRPVPAATLSDPLRSRRTQLLKRVEDLSNDAADSVCLTMQLVPREQIFDRCVRPRDILLRYTNRASPAAELDFLERVLNDSRR